MLILDTDHMRVFMHARAGGGTLRDRLRASGDTIATTIVTVEESLRGWLAEIHRRISPHDQIRAYGRLHEEIELYAAWLVLPWEADAADLFVTLRRQGIRIGTMDLKIAAIALAYDATVITRNTADFAQVPGLKFQNWLD